MAAFAIGYIKTKNGATHANNAFDRMRNETGSTMDDKAATPTKAMFDELMSHDVTPKLVRTHGIFSRSIIDIVM